ncbi:MAG: hypothetical protein ACUVTZ_08555 [Armatimonadota bacterium]
MAKVIRITGVRVRSIAVDLDESGEVVGSAAVVEEVQEDGTPHRMERVPVKLTPAQVTAVKKLAGEVTAVRKDEQGI